MPPETTPARPAHLRRAPRSMPPETTPARPARLRRAPRPHTARDHTCAASPPASCSSFYASRDHTCAASPPASCSSAAYCPRPHLRGLPACVVLLGRILPETTPARPARLRRAPRFYASRDHTCAACPPASCSSAAYCPRPHLRGLPACVVLLVLCLPRPHLRGQPACVVLLGRILPETTPARPARLRRAPRPHTARDHTCAASPPASCSSVLCLPRPHLRGQPACVVLLGRILPETTPARPARLRRAPRSMPPETTPARPARLRRAPRPHTARDHTCAASPPASCSSAAYCPRPHLRGQPACVVLLVLCLPRPHLRGQPACVVLLGRILPETTPARPARLRRAPRPHTARDHTCAASPPASCSSAAYCPRPHLRGQPACVVLLGSMPPETTPARPARLRRAPRPHTARDHTCAASPPASCSSAAYCPRPHLRGQPACVVLLGSMPPETTPARPARLRRAPRPHTARDHTCAASPPASCSSAAYCPRTTPARLARLRRAPRPHTARDTPARPARLLVLLGSMPPETTTCAASPPASCSSSAYCPRPHLRGLPACVVLLGSMPPETTLRGQPACVVLLAAYCRDHTCVACPPASCSSAAYFPRPHLRGLPSCVVLLGSMPPETTPARPAHLRRAPRRILPETTPAWPARLRRAPRRILPRPHLRAQPACVVLLVLCLRDHTCAACPLASCSSSAYCPRPHLRSLPACFVLLGFMPPETTPARPARLRRAPRFYASRDHTCAASPPASCSSPHTARDHTCAASPPASCSSAAYCPRPHCAASPPASCSSAHTARDHTARPARLRRAPRPHTARDHTCAPSPPASCSSPHTAETTPARPARLRRAPRFYASRDQPARPARLRRAPRSMPPRPHLRSLPACFVLLGRILPETTPARPARLRRAPRFYASETTPARPARLRRAPRRILPETTPARPARLRRAPRSMPPETTPARPAHLRRAPRSMPPRPHLRAQPACVVLLVLCLRDHTCAASPPASCSSPHTAETTPARPALLRRAPRFYASRDHTCAASPPARAPRSMPPETTLRGQPACVVLLVRILPETTPARPARLRRAPRFYASRDHTCAASPPASCSSAAYCPRPHLRGQPACVVLLGSMLPRPHLRAQPACVVLLGSMPPETHLRGQPTCVVLLD
ncbi:hypothetical protein C4D60_Mb03t18440 [Musa balbisiana]|uniref:Uncharacterized protein n=1 Tax=Musa balbisiana TaxID=52838 RepID=A0A4V4H673_MUSBA|nr:hypothetical protein C4D60_Mb03t18440 [Musa balbisiana]